MSKGTYTRLEKLVLAIQFTEDCTIDEIGKEIKYNPSYFRSVYKKPDTDKLFELVFDKYRVRLIKGLAKAYYEYSGNQLSSDRKDQDAQSGGQKPLDQKVIFEAALKQLVKLKPGPDATKGMQVAYQNLLNQLEMGIVPEKDK